MCLWFHDQPYFFPAKLPTLFLFPGKIVFFRLRLFHLENSNGVNHSCNKFVSELINASTFQRRMQFCVWKTIELFSTFLMIFTVTRRKTLDSRSFVTPQQIQRKGHLLMYKPTCSQAILLGRLILNDQISHVQQNSKQQH